MDKIIKFLNKLSDKERNNLDQIISRVSAGDLSGLDVKKLKGERNIFRVRKGDLRVIFQKAHNSIVVIAVGRRSDTTYGNF